MATSRKSPRRRAALLALPIAALALVAAACTPAPPPAVYDSACAGTLVASTPGMVANAAVDELSGIAASRRNPGAYWVHNDSGNPAVVYAVGEDGGDLGSFTLDGATNVDWEDVAVGPGPNGPNYLYVADIGGLALPTQSSRSSIVVYRVPEPAVPGSGSLTGVDTLTFTYEGGDRYDAEALLVDPVSGRIYVITKQVNSAQVFEAGIDGVLRKVADLSIPTVAASVTAVTAADVTPTGDVVAIRVDEFPSTGPGFVVLYPRPSGGALVDAFAQTPCNGAVGAEAQGEAIGFTSDGRGYVTASEGAGAPLHQFRSP